MDVIRVDSTDPEWDGFVWDSPGGTIFHTLRFLAYHPPGRFEFHHLVVKEGGRTVCLVPGGCIAVNGARHYRSPVGASFGGFVFARGLDLDMMFEAVHSVVDYTKEAGFVEVDIDLPPACYFDSGIEALGFAITSSGFLLRAREATSVVPLAQVNLGDLPPGLRRNVRRARQAGVTVRTGRDIAVFHKILSANLATKEATPTHSVAELERLVDLFPERVQLFEAWLANRMVGGCLSFICNRRAALAFYICDDPGYRQFRVSECVLHSATAWFKGQGYRYLDLGTISIDGQVNWGLARFKAKFMAETYVREKYTLTFGGQLDH
jgi:hypothetical protein